MEGSVCIRFLNLAAYHHGYEGKHCSGQPDQGVASCHFHTFSAQPCAEEAAALVADEYDAKEGGKILGTEESSYQAGGWRHGGAAGETKDDQVSENHRCCLRQQQECQNPDDTAAVKRSHHVFHRKPVGQEPAGQGAGDGGKTIDGKGQGGDGIRDFVGQNLGIQVGLDDRHVGAAVFVVCMGILLCFEYLFTKINVCLYYTIKNRFGKIEYFNRIFQNN